jgi:hypothetical protein
MNKTPISRLLLLLAISCQQQPSPKDLRKDALATKFATAKVNATLKWGLTEQQGKLITKHYVGFKNIDSLAAWVDSISPLLEAGKYAIGGPAHLSCMWKGYQNNVVVKAFNTDSIYSEARLLDYCTNFEGQSKPYQIVHLFFFKGNALKEIPIPQYEPTNPENPKTTGSMGVLNLIKAQKPYATVNISGERDYSYHKGFEY